MTPGDDNPFTPFDGALFAAISLIWGSSFLLIAIGLEDLTPGMVTFARVGSGALALLVLKWVGSSRSERIRRADLGRVFILSITWVAVPFTLFPLAQEHINSALTGLLNGATPIFVAVVGTALTGLRPKGLVLAGLVLGFVGVVVLSLPSLGDGSSQAGGVLLVVAATVCYGLAINLAAPLQRRYGAVTLMSAVLAMATVWLIPVGLRDLGRNRWEADTLVPVLVLGVVGTGLAYWVMSTLVGRVGPVRASFITYLIPVVSLVLGVLIRNDDVAVLSLIGAAMTTAGAVLASGRIGGPRQISARPSADGQSGPGGRDAATGEAARSGQPMA
ncbi:MAG: DMT family transporter [Actinomycetota bacterium]